MFIYLYIFLTYLFSPNIAEDAGDEPAEIPGIIFLPFIFYCFFVNQFLFSKTIRI